MLCPSLRAAGAPGLGAAPQHLAAFGVPALVPQSHHLPPGCPPRAPLPHPMLGWGPGTIPPSTCLVLAALLHPAGTVPPPEPPSPFVGSREGVPQPQPPPCCSSCKQEGAQHSTDTPSKALFLKNPLPCAFLLPWGARPHLPQDLHQDGASPAPAPSPLPAAQITSSRCLFLLGAVVEASSPEGFFFFFFFLSAELCGPALGSGFVGGQGVCIYFVPRCVPVNSVSYFGLMMYMLVWFCFFVFFQWMCLVLAFLSSRIKCSETTGAKPPRG